MSIRMFKIISGEYIVSETTIDSDSKYTFKSPMVVHFAPHPSGQLALNLFPLNPFAMTKNEEIILKDIHIMFETPVQEGIEKEYIRITSGIITVSKPAPSLEIIKP